MTIQVPKAVRNIKKQVNAYMTNNPQTTSTYDIDCTTLDNWRALCNDSELFDCDLDRYIGDIFTFIQYSN